MLQSSPICLNILIIEHNPDVATFLAFGLTNRGHHVELAENGRTGLHRASEPRLHCVLVDLQEPGIDGLTLTRTLRSAGVHMAIIVLISGTDAQGRIKVLQAGADDCCRKPVRLDEWEARMLALSRRSPWRQG